MLFTVSQYFIWTIYAALLNKENPQVLENVVMTDFPVGSQI